MKLYKCRIKITTVREGLEIMESPSEELAKDPLWVTAADSSAILESLETTKEESEVVSIEEITTISQVAPEWHDSLPWYHPTQTPNDQYSIKERLAPELEAGCGRWVADEIHFLEKQKLKLEIEIQALRDRIAK